MKKQFRHIAVLFLTGLFIGSIGPPARAQNSSVTDGEGVNPATTIKQGVAQRLSFVTIGAKDLNKLKQFYIEKFNWVPLPGNGGIVFFKMNGFIFALYPSEDIASGAGVKQDGSGFKRLSFTINYRSEKEIDEVFKTLASRGVNIIKAPKKASWGGYIGYIADVEDNIWEIAYNPFVEMDNDGNTIAHH
ncbi:hypothetical protein BH09BAC6_BH09BAC6_17090 [soil metagenome]|jgi:predicted enzyme related to lactoylglutathione lyase